MQISNFVPNLVFIQLIIVQLADYHRKLPSAWPTMVAAAAAGPLFRSGFMAVEARTTSPTPLAPGPSRSPIRCG
ncbi:hypothetical protein GWI33_019793 [Rhynchophorus ferrugineus]|uniref:Uncharacterized protein n=1 Tax=Rhynchophorus ferrugineus TaxID=354439 RepID=A0A834HTP6_RHYFE|nr:hypothetical protein GWI33_019793 [Rhynchophorus ferrugineus]